MKETSSRQFPKWFYIVLTLIPVIVVVIIEVFLRSINYGNNYSTFVKISDQFENLRFFNPILPQKYFGNLPVTPSVISDGFKKIKNKNTFRIFALGGSTTAGFPHPPNGSFPRLLKGLLQKNYPYIDFEVINLGVSAINTITIRDLIDDVLNEKPDLIIIYTGHNEYYGALGPASNVSSFNNLFVTRLVLILKEFRTVQLIENVITQITSIFSEEVSSSKTLMSEMAGKNFVPYNSDEFHHGIEQFESNLDYILSKCEEENVPTLIGTLASNLLQEPLCKNAGCDSLVMEFKNISRNFTQSTKEKLYRIKDKDELRFRAPEKFNKIILNYSKKYNCDVFDVQRLFEELSPNEIIGDNLMLDHLHPTFNGNMVIAKSLFEIIQNAKIIDVSKNKIKRYPEFMMDSYRYSAYSNLDSSFANLRIKYLKADFPFTLKKDHSLLAHSLESIEDSIAQEIIDGRTSWEDAHLKLANIYFKENDYNKYMNEINVLIEDKPFDKFPYFEALKSLKSVKEVELIKQLLLKYYKVYPDLFSSRELGDIYFSHSKHNESIYFYNKCIQLTSKDPKIYFNLSASYFTKKDLNNSLKNIQECLKLNPNYPNAHKIYNGLIKISQSKN